MADQQTPGQELPPYVVTEADRKRWDDAEAAARNLLGDAPEDAIWALRRELYHDRETNPS